MIINKSFLEDDNMLDEYPDVLNTKEVMEILDITKNLLYRLIHTKQLPAYRIGSKKWRINKSSLIEYLHSLES